MTINQTDLVSKVFLGSRATLGQLLHLSKPVSFHLRWADAGNSLGVQWLGFQASTAGGTGSIPGQGTKIPPAARCAQKTNKQQQHNKDR